MKADLHRHLEGSHTARALLKVAAAHRIQLPMLQQTEAELGRQLLMQGPAGDSGAFYAAIELARQAYVSAAVIGELTFEAFVDSAQGLDAVELRVSLFSMTRTLLSQGQSSSAWRGVPPTSFAEQARAILLQLQSAKERAARELNKPLLMRLGLSRTFESEPHYRAMAAMVNEHAGVFCGLDVLGILSGPEREPLQPGLVKVIELLRPLLPDLTIHAGEFEDHHSVQRALDLSPRGIGHGTHAVGDQGTLDRLARDGVTVEVCPGSNALLIPEALYALRAMHGGRAVLPTLQQHRVHAVIGSDDPVPMGTSYQAEWEAVLADDSASRESIELLARDTRRRYEQIVAAAG